MHFVVHKHAARRLHYDLRLEHRGVLLSWAVPKGPGRKKGLKRLAIRVEDHPLSYKDFEGKIPEGEYGAGTVEIWDKGGYLFQGASSRSDSEKKLRAGLKKGHIAIAFYGKKLKGDYHLIQMKQAGLKNWLLYRAL
jgi:bifunctional non-homologous end joining protein LigD